jgi:hypothetical protein
MSSVVALRTTRRSPESRKAYRRTNKALITRIDEKKTTDLAMLDVPSPADAAGIEMPSYHR